MSESISYSVAARVNAGPVLTASGAIEAEAYDKIEVTIPANTTTALTVNVAPVKWSSVMFLAVKPKQADKQLTYDVGGTDIAVDGPHVLVGAGAVALLGTGNAALKFKNAAGTDATVDILVGRKAT